MQLYNTTTPHNSIIHEIWALCDAEITSYPLKDVVRRVNMAMETLVALIINAVGTWQWDDTNYTTTPIGTGTLVEGQSSYSFASEYLEIENVKIKDTNGNWYILTPIDQSEYYAGVGINGEPVALEQLLSVGGTTVSGQPLYYDKNDDTIRIYPAPSATYCTLASGLKVQFIRSAKLYTMSNSTTITAGEESVEPGIASPFHQLIAYMSALPYCQSYKKDRVPLYKTEVNERTAGITRFYGMREKDKRSIATMRGIRFR